MSSPLVNTRSYDARPPGPRAFSCACEARCRAARRLREHVREVAVLAGIADVRFPDRPGNRKPRARSRRARVAHDRQFHATIAQIEHALWPDWEGVLHRAH